MADLWVWVQPGLQGRFQSNQSYSEKPCLQKTNNKISKKHNNNNNNNNKFSVKFQNHKIRIIKFIPFLISSISTNCTILVIVDSYSLFYFQIHLSYIVSCLKFPLSPFLPVLPLTFPLTKSTLPPFPFRKSKPLSPISTKHSITSKNKTRHMLCESWMRQSSRRKGFPRTGKRVREHPYFHCWEFHKNTNLHLTQIQRI